MKKSSAKQPPRLNKLFFESGLQCHRRLWIDANEPEQETLSLTRANLAAIGTKLTQLAASAFPKGIEVAGRTAAARAVHTQQLLKGGEPVVVGATFVSDAAECQVDIVVQHQDRQLDLFEVKSGTKVKLRYLTDIALQLHTAEANGHQVRNCYLLHVQPRYVHKAGTDFPPMQLLRSTDVTARVRKLQESVAARMEHLRLVLAASKEPSTPMGSQCTTPFRCPHYDRCAKQASAQELVRLPELTRRLEVSLRRRGIHALDQLDVELPDLSFKQRRTLAAIQQGECLVEPFIKQELRDVKFPLHFIAVASVTEPLPRFEGQRPWRHVPYGWSARTLHEDGRLERAGWFYAEKEDPRPEFLAGLAKQVECGGTIVCWNDRAITDLRELLEDTPDAKEQVRSILARDHLDLMHLLDAGVFHPALSGHSDLATSTAALLPSQPSCERGAFGEESMRATLEKMNTPRSRKATRDKVAEEMLEQLHCAVEAMLALYRHFAEVEEKAKPAPKPTKSAMKKLPKPV